MEKDLVNIYIKMSGEMASNRIATLGVIDAYKTNKSVLIPKFPNLLEFDSKTYFNTQLIPMTRLLRYASEFDYHFLKEENWITYFLKNEFISHFVYFESFFQELNRFILTQKPEFLSNTDKYLTWKEIINSENKESMISTMVDRISAKSGYIKIYDLIETWNKPPYLFKIRLKKAEIDFIKEMTLIRNFIVHNNDKYSIDYIKNYPDKGKKQGDTFEYNEDFNGEYFINLSNIIFMVFASVREYFFDTTIDDSMKEFGFKKI